MKRILITIFLVLPFISFSQIDIVPDDDGILFTENGKEVIYYQIEPRSKDGKYARCNYFHPLWDTAGNVITEDFPADHLHHRGIFWGWHQVLKNGKSLGNLWELKDIEQEVAEVEFAAQASGAGVLKTEVLWKSVSGLSYGVAGSFIKENATVTIHTRKKNYRKIDFEISLVALTEGIQLGGSDDEKGYGGFSVRMKLPADVTFTGPAGAVVPEVTQVSSPGWVNISGTNEKSRKRYGIIIIDHPENIGFPQKWILRREKSMQNIVFPGRNPVEIPVNKPVTLKYSLLVYNGKISKGVINRAIK